MSDLRTPRAAVVEIYERGGDLSEIGPGSVLCPNEIRINGTPVYGSADDPVVVQSIRVDPPGAVYVTLTLLARRVIIDTAAVDVPAAASAPGLEPTEGEPCC